MQSTKMTQLEGLDEGIISLVLLERTFTIIDGNKKKTDQAISNATIDIAAPPTGSLTPFNIYAALSRCRGRESIRLLQESDEKLFTSHPSKYLWVEDERLFRFDSDTEKWWNTVRNTNATQD
ncbi:hypothetical protein J3R83DRAFT_1121 [Lanmaoa asiatica]|nr:hypothetical protein J3R83DRAFT_1121 [Lanmaoa asiatica]